ncbi:MAG: hypothetical protein WHV44_00205 [Anaerolineales bacterium]
MMYFWQFTNTTTWAGGQAICIEAFNGSRNDLKTWCRDPQWKPGTVSPEPLPEPQPEPEPGPVDLTEINAKLDRIIAELEGLKWLQRS